MRCLFEALKSAVIGMTALSAFMGLLWGYMSLCEKIGGSTWGVGIGLGLICFVGIFVAAYCHCKSECGDNTNE